MEKKSVKVTIKNIAQSALKLRLVADMIRGMQADTAASTLKFVNKKGAEFVLKALESASAGASERFNLEKEQLVVSAISVDEAPTYKRARFASRGRSSRILKRRSHINLEVSQK